jgi:hypothetical protein
MVRNGYSKVMPDQADLAEVCGEFADSLQERLQQVVKIATRQYDRPLRRATVPATPSGAECAVAADESGIVIARRQSLAKLLSPSRSNSGSCTSGPKAVWCLTAIAESDKSPVVIVNPVAP